MFKTKQSNFNQSNYVKKLDINRLIKNFEKKNPSDSNELVIKLKGDEPISFDLDQYYFLDNGDYDINVLNGIQNFRIKFHNFGDVTVFIDDENSPIEYFGLFN